MRRFPLSVCQIPIIPWRAYRQEVNLFKLGRMPLNCVIDANGYVRFAHYGKSMSDIPSNDALLHVIDELNAASH